MAQGILVENQIDDGRKLIKQLVADGLDVTAAFWARTSEDDERTLYIASKVVAEQGTAAAYQAVYQALQRLQDPWLTILDVKVIGANSPMAKDVLELLRRYPERMPTRLGRTRLGGAEVEEAYIYAPASVTGAPDPKWRGIEVRVSQEPDAQDAYRVEFWPQELQAPLSVGGRARRVPRPAAVRVVKGQAAEYIPPEKPVPQLKESDYRQKALQAVEQVAEARA